MDYRHFKGFVAQVNVRRNGGSLTINLPPTLVGRLHLAAGDPVFVFKHERGFVVTPYDPVFDKAMDDFDRNVRAHRNTFRRLAKP